MFLTHGYDAATTGEIARAADVAAGTFYLHFRDKRAVYDQLARRAAHDLLSAWRTALGPGRFRITGLMLHMPGRWRLTFDLVHDDARTRLVREVELRP